MKGAALVKAKSELEHQWENPNSVKYIQSFPRFTNYYRRFVQKCASVASTLTILTKKDVVWHWDPLQHRAFETLKTTYDLRLSQYTQILLSPEFLCQMFLGMLFEEY